MILSEGAGAILLGRSGAIKIDMTQAGECYFSRKDARKSLEGIVSKLTDPETDIVIASANGTFIDAAEAAVINKALPNPMVYSPKPALGESVGASGLWQTIVAAQALGTQSLPPLLHVPANAAIRAPGEPIRMRRALVLSCGLNQQAAGIRLST